MTKRTDNILSKAGLLITDDPHEVKEQIKHNLGIIDNCSWTIGQREGILKQLKNAEVILKDLANELSKPKLPEVLWEGQVEYPGGCEGYKARILKAGDDMVTEYWSCNDLWTACSKQSTIDIFKAAFLDLGKSPK
jgi:hypothetical protein